MIEGLIIVVALGGLAYLATRKRLEVRQPTPEPTLRQSITEAIDSIVEVPAKPPTPLPKVELIPEPELAAIVIEPPPLVADPPIEIVKPVVAPVIVSKPIPPPPPSEPALSPTTPVLETPIQPPAPIAPSQTEEERLVAEIEAMNAQIKELDRAESKCLSDTMATLRASPLYQSIQQEITDIKIATGTVGRTFTSPSSEYFRWLSLTKQQQQMVIGARSSCKTYARQADVLNDKRKELRQQLAIVKIHK